MATQDILALKVEQEIKTIEEHKFEPIKGYPMLHWKGKRPFTSTQYYPAQLKETYGENVNGWMNKIFWGDNLQVMSHLLKEYRGRINLIYIDPPFDSKADYKKKIRLRGQQINNDLNAFEEKQYHDLWNNDEYLQFIYERLILLRELLSDEGSLYFHCDWHQVHYVKLILDELFGKGNFMNEIVWKRTRAAHSDATYFGKVHDTILLYKKGKNSFFENLYTEHSEEYIKRFNKEEGGRKYMLVPLHGPGQGVAREFFGKMISPPLGRCWPSQQTINFYIEKGLVELTSNGTPSKKSFEDENKGNPISDWWDDIVPLNPVATERTDYPTQKPEQLLERIIQTSSKPGDLIFDCFMGSGTTQNVAMKLGRKFIGADINLGAIQTTTKRLAHTANELKSQLVLESKLFTGFEVYNVNHYDIFRNPAQAKDILIKSLEIQPLPNNNVYDGEKDCRMVKIMPINRIATRSDLNELITNFDYKTFEKVNEKNPGKPVESLLLVCMGHEPDLAASLQSAVPYKLDIEVIDILRDNARLEFKRDAEAEIIIEGGKLVIREFYPMNLLQKLSLMKENVENWKELADSVMIDFNYDGAVFEPQIVDVPEGNNLVKGTYNIPSNAGAIRVKITDLLSETLEQTVTNG